MGTRDYKTTRGSSIRTDRIYQYGHHTSFSDIANRHVFLAGAEQKINKRAIFNSPSSPTDAFHFPWITLFLLA